MAASDKKDKKAGLFGRGLAIAKEWALALEDIRLMGKHPEDRMIVLDNSFPSPLSPFRIAEFNSYLEHFPTAEVHSSYAPVFEKTSSARIIEDYFKLYPQYHGRVRRLSMRRNFRSRVLYSLFLRNAVKYLPIAERARVPFVFTLYPGFGFSVEQASSDQKLTRLMTSRFFGKVIVTQKLTYEYLLEKKFCDPSQIEFVYGAVIPADKLTRQPIPHKRYGVDKPTFDVCFVAFKYMESGVNKGYDIFIDAAKRLIPRHADIRFHVIGNFTPEDIDVSGITDQITFYGPRNTSFFPEFYSGMDIILTPNRPFVFGPGSFDGFPTASSMEAGLNGVVVVCTDELKLNIAFKDGEEIVIIPPDGEAASEAIERFYQDGEALQTVAARGQTAFRRVFGLEAQMGPRIKVFEEFLK